MKIGVADRNIVTKIYHRCLSTFLILILPQVAHAVKKDLLSMEIFLAREKKAHSDTRIHNAV